ncbi:immunoglobulin superfamily member 8-like [Carassius auratus]|uniref:immunoglobulin superfamily member 8-like n=1 Tax=Carassius auratus TaxID=7957 RepID=UPI000E40CE58|nr:immunoglobulin superfamily member 8-like [Carassius auratus]
MALRWITFIALLWELQCCMCREVTLPAGPLYRVAGFSLSLPCSVSGYEGPQTQDFEWYLYREDAGGQQMGVVSTRDTGFPYAPFQSRVQVGEVRVERDSGDKARLIIQRLHPGDQGRYECYTPSTDTRFLGNYSSSVVVKVIPDTLLITHSRILSGQPMIEGTELQLTCAAAVQSDQHTHVSVTFHMRSSKGAESQGPTLSEIISIDPELHVTPGHSATYRKRYRDGEIAVEKRRGGGVRDLYVLKMSVLTAEDSGSYFCEAAQWIRDPDGKWERIAQRTMELGNLTVQPLADTLSVRLLPEGDVSLRPGAPLRLRCQVSGVGSALLVQWMRRGSEGGVELEVGRVDPDGVVVWGDDLSRAGGRSLEKEADGSFSLHLFSVHPSDTGLYRCAVSVYTRRKTPAPDSPATITQRSDWVTVSLKTEEVRVSASIAIQRRPLLKRGSTVTLLCNVSVDSSGASRVEVQWLQTPSLSEDRGRLLLATLSYDGLTRIYSSSSELSVDRVSAGCFRMRIFSAAEEDQGHYQCRAQVWAQDPRGGWYSSGAEAQSVSVHLYLYTRVTDLLLVPLVIGVSSALFVAVLIISAVTCCFMNRQHSHIWK